MWTFFWPRLPLPTFELWRWPADLALNQARRQLECQRRTVDMTRQPGVAQAGQLRVAWHDLIAATLAWPFDLARLQHSAAVQLGLLPKSLLQSSHVEQRLGALERLTLGPLARSL